MEQVFEKPPIYIFRAFASEREIEELKQIADPQVSIQDSYLPHVMGYI